MAAGSGNSGVPARRGVRVAVLVLTVVLGLSALGAGCAGPSARSGQAAQLARAQGKPNVIVVMTDDQWLESMRFMPRTQQVLGGAGVTFDRYYPSMPLCCPSRSTFLSGQFPHNNNVRHNAPPQGGYAKLDENRTLPVWMQRAGYATSHIGKYPNGYGNPDKTHVPPGWDEWRGSVDPTTYQMYGYELNENGKVHRYGNFAQEDPRFYQTDVYANKASDFIQRQSDNRQPFFLSLAFLAPHGEKTSKKPGEPDVGPGPRPAPRHKGRFASEPLPPMPSFNEPDATDKPQFVQDYPNIDAQKTERITHSYRARAESLLAVDEAVDKLVTTLQETGQLENTYLMFVSDNGFFFGQHRIPTGKFLPHEASGHVPMLLRGPGIPAGQSSQELMSNADLAATIAEVGGAQPDLPLDGRSMLPYAREPELRTQRPVLHEAAEGALKRPISAAGGQVPPDDAGSGQAAAEGDLDQDGVASPPRSSKKRGPGQVLSAAYEAIRTERYLYVRYTPRGSGAGAVELYDLHVDPAELHSAHADPRYAQVRQFLDQQLDALQGCGGSTCNREIPPAPAPN